MGWNRSSESGGANTPGSPHVGQPKFVDGTVRGKGPRSAVVRGAIAAAIVVVGAVAVWWLLAPSTERQTPNVKRQTSKSPLLKEAVPAAAPRATDDAASVAKKVQPEKPKFDTNKWKQVGDYIIPKNARLVRNSLTNKVKKIFNHGTDFVIASYLQPPQGGVMPPMLPIMPGQDKKFLASLSDPIIIEEADSDEVRSQKEAVIVARAQIKEQMDQGRSFEEILVDHYNLAKENLEIRSRAQKELTRIYRSGDLDGARKYENVMNAAIGQMGIEPLDKPMTIEEKNAAKRKRRELEFTP